MTLYSYFQCFDTVDWKLGWALSLKKRQLRQCSELQICRWFRQAAKVIAAAAELVVLQLLCNVLCDAVTATCFISK